MLVFKYWQSTLRWLFNNSFIFKREIARLCLYIIVTTYDKLNLISDEDFWQKHCGHFVVDNLFIDLLISDIHLICVLDIKAHLQVIVYSQGWDRQESLQHQRITYGSSATNNQRCQQELDSQSTYALKWLAVLWLNN